MCQLSINELSLSSRSTLDCLLCKTGAGLSISPLPGSMVLNFVHRGFQKDTAGGGGFSFGSDLLLAKPVMSLRADSHKVLRAISLQVPLVWLLPEVGFPWHFMPKLWNLVASSKRQHLPMDSCHDTAAPPPLQVASQ